MKSKSTDSTRAPSDKRGSLRSKLLRAMNRVYCHGYHRIKVQAPLRLPATGAAILVCNHISGLDPLLLQSVASRPIVWMMAREYYNVAALRWLYQAVEAIPVERNGRDSSATRAALRALAGGRVLGIFPEGRIEKTKELLPFQSGVAMMAVRTRTPIFPAYLDGTNRGMNMVEAFLNANHVKIRFGPAIDLTGDDAAERPDLDRCGERIFHAVLTLKSTTL